MISEMNKITNLQDQASDEEAAKKNRSLRILMILHMPWNRELGAPRVSIETAEELQAMGHAVDKFDINDAFPKRSKVGSFFEMALFPSRAARFVRQNGHRYDVIQAEQGNLPYTKGQLNFSGFLIARSNGLAHFYDQYERKSQQKRRMIGQKQGSLVGNTLRWFGKRMGGGLTTVERSFDTADVIILINQDECDYVSRRLSHSDKAFLLPNGLSEDRFTQFAAHQTSPDERLESQQVVFIGHWGERKGAADFPDLVHAVRQQAPGTRFLFLGTGKSTASVLGDFKPEDRDSIEIVPFFRSQDLPALLSLATVGTLPSYIEGFGIGVLEQLASGIPSIAYDVPGPREMLKHFSQSMLTPVGDINVMTDRLIALLHLSLSDYSVLHREALQIASRFRWRNTAVRMMEIIIQNREITRSNE